MHEPPTKCFCNGAVTCWFKVLSSFNVSFRGQYAASQRHHCRNTNVGGKHQSRLSNVDRKTAKKIGQRLAIISGLIGLTIAYILFRWVSYRWDSNLTESIFLVVSGHYRQREYLRSSGASEATSCPRQRTH